jgi:hypothetical protein
MHKGQPSWLDCPFVSLCPNETPPPETRILPLTDKDILDRINKGILRCEVLLNHNRSDRQEEDRKPSHLQDMDAQGKLRAGSKRLDLLNEVWKRVRETLTLTAYQVGLNYERLFNELQDALDKRALLLDLAHQKQVRILAAQQPTVLVLNEQFPARASSQSATYPAVCRLRLQQTVTTAS